MGSILLGALLGTMSNEQSWLQISIRHVSFGYCCWFASATCALHSSLLGDFDSTAMLLNTCTIGWMQKTTTCTACWNATEHAQQLPAIIS